MAIYQRVISDIVSNTGIRAISESQHSKIENILKNFDLNIDDKINAIMEELRLRGTLYRKDIREAIDFYIEFLS